MVGGDLTWLMAITLGGYRAEWLVVVFVNQQLMLPAEEILTMCSLSVLLLNVDLTETPVALIKTLARII